MVKNQDTIREVLAGWYPEFDFTDAGVYYNDFNFMFYIHARMRRKKDNEKETEGKKAKAHPDDGSVRDGGGSHWGGIDWMTRAELAEAIPPAYTEFLGKQLIEYIKEQEATECDMKEDCPAAGIMKRLKEAEEEIREKEKTIKKRDKEIRELKKKLSDSELKRSYMVDPMAIGDRHEMGG